MFSLLYYLHILPRPSPFVKHYFQKFLKLFIHSCVNILLDRRTQLLHWSDDGAWGFPEGGQDFHLDCVVPRHFHAPVMEDLGAVFDEPQHPAVADA